MEFKKHFNRIFDILVPCLFIVLLLLRSLARVPFFDESHAYTIAQFPIKQIISLTGIEGHTILWYLLLKITSFNPNFFPYSMQILNWFFASLTIVFFWKYSPFNRMVKFLLLLSVPFFDHFGIIARPYALSLLILFLLTHFYKTKLCFKKPYLFCILLVLCAHCPIVPAIGGFGIFCLFLYDVIKDKKINKKTLSIVFSIIFIGGILLLLQLYNPDLSSVHERNGLSGFHLDIIKFTLFPFLLNCDSNHIQLAFNFVCMVCFYSCLIGFFKIRKALFFFLFTYALLTLLFLFVYPGCIWHYYFYLVFLLIDYWIFYDELKLKKKLNTTLCVLLLFCICPFSFFINGKDEILDTSKYPKIFEIIADFYNEEEAKIYALDYFNEVSVGMTPYFNINDMKIYDKFGYELGSYDNLKNIFNHETIKTKEFLKIYDKNKKNYFLKHSNIFYECFDNNKLTKTDYGYLYVDNGVKMALKEILDNNETRLSVWEIKVLDFGDYEK